MGYREHDGVVGARGRFIDQRDAVLALCVLAIDPRIDDVDDRAIIREFAHDIDYARVAQVGAILFERQSHHRIRAP